MLLGEVFKNINKKYKNIYFKNIRFNSKDNMPNFNTKSVLEIAKKTEL